MKSQESNFVELIRKEFLKPCIAARQHVRFVEWHSSLSQQEVNLFTNEVTNEFQISQMIINIYFHPRVK